MHFKNKMKSHEPTTIVESTCHQPSNGFYKQKAFFLLELFFFLELDVTVVQSGAFRLDSLVPIETQTDSP